MQGSIPSIDFSKYISKLLSARYLICSKPLHIYLLFKTEENM
jgi:hypothetical protein